MAFKGITFAGQNVTPKNDGGLYQAHYGDGILWGCSMAISGDDLVIQSGEFIMGGRVVQVDGATNVDLSGRTLQTGYIQVIMNADLSQGEGSQWYTTFVESATTTFPALTKDDINDTGTLYQLELAVVQISGGNLTSIVTQSQLTPSTLLSRELDIFGVENEYMPNIGMFVDNDQVGSIQTVTNTKDVRLTGRSNGSVYGGFALEPAYGEIIFGNGSNQIYFRPNGIFDSTHQVTIDQNGQIVGGVTRHTVYNAGAISCSYNSTTSVATQSGLNTNGIYFASATCACAPNSATGTQIRGTLNGGGGLSYTNSIYTFQNGESFFMAVSGIFYGVTSIDFTIRPYSNTVSCTASVRRLEIIRIA